MINIFSKVYNTLIATGYTVREQGGFRTEDTLPESFITYFLVDSPDVSHADNLATGRTYRVQVTLYSKKPSVVQGAEGSIGALMRSGGFLRMSGRALPFNADTGHYAFAIDYRYFDLVD